MEILILLLLLGVGAIVFLYFKFSAEDTKQQKNIEDAKMRRITDLEAEMARKDIEMKKMMEERQKLEDEFFKSKDQVDIFKKENAEFLAKIKILEKAKDETSESKTELKQKEMMLQQETVARQKLQGEISLKDLEIDKINKELAVVRQELKAKNEAFEGLKGQYNELEAEIQKVREAALKKPEPRPEPKAEPRVEPKIEIKPEVKQEVKAEPPKAEPPKAEPPKAEPPKAEPPKAEPPKAEPPKAEPKAEPKPQIIPQPPPKPVVEPAKPSDGEVPGFPKDSPTKLEIKKDVPSDMDFLKAESPKKADEDLKFTNVNRPASQEPKKEPQAPAAEPKKEPPKDKDKSKTKREVLIDGFHPKPPPPPKEPES